MNFRFCREASGDKSLILSQGEEKLDERNQKKKPKKPLQSSLCVEKVLIQSLRGLKKSTNVFQCHNLDV